ncbi:hypothetical protein SRHO_G00154300 [Serrasalmus rhombeus]
MNSCKRCVPQCQGNCDCSGQGQQSMMVPYTPQQFNTLQCQQPHDNQLSTLFSNSGAEGSITEKKWVIVQTSSGPRRVRVTSRINFSS